MSSTKTSLNLNDIVLKKVTSEAGELGEPLKGKYIMPQMSPLLSSFPRPTASLDVCTSIGISCACNHNHTAGKLWAPNGAIVFVVRRPGCILCREEAMDLSTNLYPRLASNSKKPKLVAVVAETTSVDGFLDAFKGGETYLDEERAFQKALGDRWLGLQGLFYPSVWKNGGRAQKKYPELQGDLKGEGRRLGGLLVLDKKGEVKYEYQEKVFGDHAPLTEVYEAVSTLQ